MMRSSLPLLVSLAACATPALVGPPAAALSERDVGYRAKLFSGTWPREFPELVEEPGEDDSAAAAPETPADQVAFGCRVLLVPDAALAAWLGDARLVCAWDAPAGTVAGLLGAGDVEVLTAPRLVLNSGDPGKLSTLDQQAFVAGFEVVGGRSGILADPVVDVASHGFQLAVTATAEGSEVRLDVLAEFVSVQGLDQPRAASLPVGAPVHLQQPLTFVQRVDVEVALAADRELLVRFPDEQRGRSRLLVLRAEPARTARGA